MPRTPSYALQFSRTTRGLPGKGRTIVGWKKAGSFDRRGNFCLNRLVKLLIPASAERCMGSGDDNLSVERRKCRASYAIVLGVFDLRTGNRRPSAVSRNITAGNRLTYKTGDTVMPNAYDPNEVEVCAPGIHFFQTRAKAARYFFR